MASSEQRVVCVGLICFDMITVCDGFPLEDTDTPCREQHWARGGNASNNCTVLRQLGVPCELVGTLAADDAAKFLRDDLSTCGIPHDRCVEDPAGATPTAFIIINALNGSRTILHESTRASEVTAAQFADVDLRGCAWVHFEGRSRNVAEMREMVARIRRDDAADSVVVSVELEKPRREMEQLLPLGDFVFVSKEFAVFSGYESMRAAVEGLREKVRGGATVICPWGEEGACASTSDGTVFTAAAEPPEKVVDTIGAGDTFIAACIAQLYKGASVEAAIQAGCRVAGAKCGQMGLKDLKLPPPSPLCKPREGTNF
ncbi:PREDICTED: ketohexokinase-like [Priapulus caudatus]|uniref:Ketohexokinase-like n=1 Tax=Priapulus caudatus TaxID=37621 RepID=A0ABM1EQM6_PRICU|nr:PREDICTED: ketohexokinase-like [Priapulus caudatus]